MFSVCDAVVVNKIDYLEGSDFDLGSFERRVRMLNPTTALFEVSCRAKELISGLNGSRAKLELLESMADKAIIFYRDKGGTKSYGLLPTIPGLFEFPFMKGGGTPMHDRLAGMWKEYHDTALGASFAGNPTPVARIIPVERSLTASVRVHPYEEVARRIDQVDYIALGDCACRVAAGDCDAPCDVCLIFDGAGKFLVDRGYARQIACAEAHRVLDRAEEAGLVHTSSNNADNPTFICNCCPCCCTILTIRTPLKINSAFSTSAFRARIYGDECTGCGICIDDRCPMQAIETKDDVAWKNGASAVASASRDAPLMR